MCWVKNNLTCDLVAAHENWRQETFKFTSGCKSNCFPLTSAEVNLKVYCPWLFAIPSASFVVRWYMQLSLVMRKPVICEQQRCRSACVSTQSDQHLCCSLLDSIFFFWWGALIRAETFIMIIAENENMELEPKKQCSVLCSLLKYSLMWQVLEIFLSLYCQPLNFQTKKTIILKSKEHIFVFFFVVFCGYTAFSFISIGIMIQYPNVPKFSDRQVWANSADPDQTAPRGSVWSGSTLFAIPSASFGCITLRKGHLAQLLGWLQQIFGCPKF